MSIKPTRRILSYALALTPSLIALATGPAHAAGAGAGAGTALPWDNALEVLAGALTGNTAKWICAIAIFIAGVALIFGEDLGQFAKRLLMIVIAAAFLVGAGSFFTSYIQPSAGGHI